MVQGVVVLLAGEMVQGMVAMEDQHHQIPEAVAGVVVRFLTV